MSLLTLNRASVSRLAQHLGGHGVTSIGCGRGELEALLSMFIDEVVGVEAGNGKSMCPTARKTVTFSRIRGRLERRQDVPLIAQVPAHHAMLFCFPIAQIPFKEYVDEYCGSTIVVISDDTCDPGPDVVIPGFELAASEMFPAPGRTPLMRVFRRANFICEVQ